MAQVSKKEQILEKARLLFLQEGFRKVSMEAIAAAVPVSKPTLYNNFSDKKDLFAAVITNCCQEFILLIEESIEDGKSVEEVLKIIAGKFLSMTLSPEGIRMHRIVTSECEDFPEMASLFYESGPQRSMVFLIEYLKKQTENNILDVPDAELSANMFLSMLKGQWHMRSMLGLDAGLSQKEQNHIIDYAVNMFLKAHTK